MNIRDVAEDAKKYKKCHQNEIELAGLLQVLVAEDPKIYVEIGTYYAGGLWAVSKVIPYAKLIGIDNSALDSTVDSRDWVKTFKIDATIISADSQSQSTVDELKEALNGDPIDFLFIDGDHEYSSVSREWELFSPLVRSQGVIAFHDISPGSPHENGSGLFWREISQKYFKKETIAVPDLGWGGVGVLWKD